MIVLIIIFFKFFFNFLHLYFINFLIGTKLFRFIHIIRRVVIHFLLLM